MGASPKHQLRALLLAFCLTLGMSLSLVQGSLMAAEMAVAAEAGQPCPHGCDGCGDDDADLDPGTCLSLCGSAVQALPPAQALALPTASPASIQTGYAGPGGRSHSPDPGPPKRLALG
jgi:hypothetical protein